MALLTKTQLEDITDSIAARTDLLLAGLANAANSPVGRSFWEKIDAVGSPIIERALGGVADDLDGKLANRAAFTNTQLAGMFGPFFQALQSQIAADGTYANFDAALTALGAAVSPHLQTMSGYLAGPLSPANVWSPTLSANALDKVLVGTDGSLSDETTDAGDTDTADFAFFSADDDVLMLGWDEKPGVAGATETLSVCMSTPSSADVVFTAKIWNGTAWVTQALSLDGTAGFTANGLLRFTVPSVWEKTAKNPAGNDIISSDLTPRYWLRLQRTANTVVTTPIGTMIRSCGNCLGVVKITGTNAATLYGASEIDTSLYDASNTLRLRPLTPIAQDVTLTLSSFTNRAGTTAQSSALSAWTSPALGTPHDPTAVAAGVASVEAITIVTTATVGLFAIESLPPRTPAA